jgi:hypothetical protein
MPRESDFKKILADLSMRFHETAHGKGVLKGDDVYVFHNATERCEGVLRAMSQGDGRLNLTEVEVFNTVYKTLLKITGAQNLRELKEKHPAHFSILKTFEAVAPHCAVREGKFRVGEAAYNDKPTIFPGDFILN